MDSNQICLYDCVNCVVQFMIFKLPKARNLSTEERINSFVYVIGAGNIFARIAAEKRINIIQYLRE